LLSAHREDLLTTKRQAADPAGITWVVYLVTMRSGLGNGSRAICERTEWDAMELRRPSYHTLVLEGITSEAEAERLARGTSGDPPPQTVRRL
jgi:hypothetical protein